MRLPATPRPGVSLLEALIACTILFITVFAISQLMDVAGQNANTVRQRSFGMQLAQSKLKELEAGVLPLTSGGGNFDEAPDWEWTLEANQNSGTNGLWYVTVSVQQQNSTAPVATLTQFIIDPSYRGNSTDAPQIQSGSSSGSSSSSPSTQSGSMTPSTPASGGAAMPSGGATSKPSGGTSGAPSGGGAKPSGGTSGAPSGGGAKPSGGGAKPSGGTGRTAGK